MKSESSINNIEDAIAKLKESANEVTHKETKKEIEKSIAEIENAAKKLNKIREQKRVFKTAYLFIIPFVAVFAFVGFMFFSKRSTEVKK